MSPSSVLDWLEGLPGPLPYLAVFAVAFAEHALFVGTLVPGEVILPLAGVAAGLQGANAISYVFGAALGYWLLRARIGRLGLRQVGLTLLRLTLAASLAAVPAALVVLGFSVVVPDTWLGSMVQLIVGGIVLLAGYVGAAAALRIREITELGGMLRARLGR